MGNRRNSIASALELRPFCIKPLKCRQQNGSYFIPVSKWWRDIIYFEMYQQI